MTSDVVPAGSDPRRLLADVRGLARRVRVARRVTWLPLLVLGLVVLGAIPVYRFTEPALSDCRAVADGQVCKVSYDAPQVYWCAAMAVAYLVIAGGYLRVARARGLGARVLPYVLTGVALVAVGVAFGAVWSGVLAHPYYPAEPPASVQFVFRLLDPAGAIGLALLVLAWLERHVALLVFALVFLVVVLVPVNFGWGVGWGDEWGMAPQLVINGGLLLLGSAGFALAGRLRRSR